MAENRLPFEEVEEIPVPDAKMYRQTILDFLDSGIRRGKIMLDFPARAKEVAKKLRGWTAVDEPVRITQDKYYVFLVRTDERI